MSDRPNVYRDVMMRLKELDGTNMSSLSSSSSSVDTTSDGWESDDSRLEIAVISADARQDSTSLLLPRDVYDELDASEKVLLPKMLEKIITSRAFRSTLKSELESAKQTSRFFMPSSSPSDAHRLPKVKWPLRTALRSSFKFRLMDIPAELRIMVAKYALRRPRAFSWIWTNYRKGPRVATLRAGSKYDLAAKLEDVNAIARTCKQLYQETQGLVLYVNIIKFDLYDMHDGSIPKRCQERSPGSNADLRAFSECLEFFRPFVSFGSTSSVRRIELVLSTIDDLLKSKDQFVGLASDVHDLKITLRLDEWSIELLGSYELRKLEELEEEGEPYVPAQQQMEQRVVEYMDQGAQVYAFVEDADVDGRNWRIFPSTMLSREVQGILEYMTEEQQVEVQKWELYGV